MMTKAQRWLAQATPTEKDWTLFSRAALRIKFAQLYPWLYPAVLSLKALQIRGIER